MSEWISVKDRLPETGNWCLCFADRQVEILFLDGTNPVFWLQLGDFEHEVTHWMPLPEPPE